VDRPARPRVDWEAIFGGSQRKINTVIIGCETDFRSRQRISKEAVKMIERLKGETTRNGNLSTLVRREIDKE
jgi:hypothetical protein